MRIMPPGGTAMFAGALVAAMALPSALCAQQRDPYPATLQFGTGLINIPTAWVSPTNSDIWIQTSGKVIEHYVEPSEMNVSTRWNSNLSIDTHWLGRFSVGISAYSQNPEWGFFGQGLLLRDNQVGFLPGIAIGVRNVGKYEHEDRFLVGHDIKLNPATGEYEEVVVNENFKTAPTFYGVATKEFALSSMSARLPASMMSLSVGYGNGLFSDDGDLGESYNEKGTIVDGLFLGARFVAHPTLNSTLTVLAENDAWDWNAGVVFNYRGLSAGLYGTELEEGGKEEDAYQVYNYTKINFALGYSGNVFDIARGVILRTRITDLTREQQRLRMDIAERNRRIAGLEVTLRRAQAGELTDIARRRAEMEATISEEREAIRRAMERLNQIQQQQPPPTQPPPTQPPPTQPPPTQPPPTQPLPFVPSSPSL